MRRLDRQHATHGSLPTAAPRGAFAAIAAVAALLLSLAVLATTPRASLNALSGARIAFLGDADRATTANARDPAATGSADTGPAAVPACPRATLAARAGVMLRHTSQPPPARA